MFNSEDTYTNRDIKPNTDMNNLMYEIDTKLSKTLKKFDYSLSWKKFYCTKNMNNPKNVVIEFSVDNGGRNVIDWIDTVLNSLNVNFKYINKSTLEFMDYQPSNHGNCGQLFISL